MAGRGGRAGCLINGCLGVLMLALVIVVGVMVSVWNTGREARAEARDQVTGAAEGARDRLAKAAADGVLLDTEIQRAVVGVEKSTESIERRGGRVTITTRFVGVVPGMLIGGAHDEGCYRFEVVPAANPPKVEVRELPYEACSFPPGKPSPPRPADVADDIAVEVRTALADGGVERVRTAEVWKTRGVEVQETETSGGQHVAHVWLRGGTGPEGRDCYEFRAREDSGTVDVKKLKPDGCYRLERERYAAEEKAHRAELDKSARKIERQLEKAAADGRLTDAELPRALSLPAKDDMSGEWVTGPDVAPEKVERSSTAVVVVARVTAPNASWCYEFRARLPAGAVTRHYLSDGCPFQPQ
ncbi:hypothetical protein KUF83_31795 [Streptomyces sp. BV286]|uniref:hypothetical protein n=1 Tax=Streptomyces sp. BV286 TaxID=2849672 RepID=UPI001C2EA06A|nr:hypothetical protein [Streptomyces sp. BV286]MBV1941113.1 hypothetical protein [Streptomyces sp. BV286]